MLVDAARNATVAAVAAARASGPARVGTGEWGTPSVRFAATGRTVPDRWRGLGFETACWFDVQMWSTLKVTVKLDVTEYAHVNHEATSGYAALPYRV